MPAKGSLRFLEMLVGPETASTNERAEISAA
jgi:hypothetical protein